MKTALADLDEMRETIDQALAYQEARPILKRRDLDDLNHVIARYFGDLDPLGQRCRALNNRYRRQQEAKARLVRS